MHNTLVDIHTTKRHLKDPQWVVVDCRFDLQQPKAGRIAYVDTHIPGARYADLNKDLSSPPTRKSGRHPLPDPTILAAKLGQWGIHQQTQVVAYDASGGAFAGRLWWLLRWLGHDAVAVLDGGWQAWQMAGFALEQDFPVMQPTQFITKVQPHLVLESVAVQQGLADKTITLIDARGRARYAGEVEPLDPVAGHVPGAINRPFEQNLTAQGVFLSADELRARFAAYASKPQQVVHMCGSGVTACHNLLAMEIAGLRGSRLYAGSWSEWIRDPARNVKKGDEA